MDGRTLEVGEILERMGQVLRLVAGAALLYVGVLSALSIAADLADPDGAGSGLLVTVGSLVAGYLLMRVTVRNAGLADGFERGFGAYFGLSLLSGLGTLLGFLLLVVPGLIVFVRWQPAVAILMAEEDVGVSAALEKSWHMTSGHFWPLAAVALIGVALLAVALAAYLSVDLGYAVPVELAVSVGNILLSCVSVYWTLFGVAVYSLLRTDRQGLVDVFA